MPPKPLIPTAAISEFGDLTDSSDFKDPSAMDNDLSYVPVFSEKRREHALAMARYAAGEISRSDVPTLPVNLRWVRNQSKSGKPDSERVFRAQQKGFRLVNANDASPDWFGGLPPGAATQADGSVQRGDVVLMVCDAQQARRNEAWKRAKTEADLTGSAEKFTDAVAQAYKHSGLPVPQGSEPRAEKMAKDEPVFGNLTPGKKSK